MEREQDALISRLGRAGCIRVSVQSTHLTAPIAAALTASDVTASVLYSLLLLGPYIFLPRPRVSIPAGCSRCSDFRLEPEAHPKAGM